MAADLGEAYVNIIPKAPGIESNIEDLLGGSGASAGVRKAGSGLGKKLMTGLKVGAAAAGVALGKIIKDSLEAGGKLEQSFGGLDTIYGDASDQAKQFAMTAAQAGISANTYAEQAVSMGAALKAAFGGDTQKAAEAANTAIMDMADNAAKMGTPIESLQAAYQGFAKGQYQLLDNLKLGYGGTKQEMERLLQDAEKFSGVKYDINNLGDVYSAIHVIQGELGLTGVAANEAKSTLQGSANAMKASWENLMAAMSTGEGFELAMANMGTSVQDFASNVFRMLGKVGEQLPGLIKGLAKTALASAPSFIHSGVELMVKLAVGVVQGIPKVISKLPQVFRQAKSAFAGYDWAALGKEALEGIAAGLKSMASLVLEAMKSVATGAWDTFKKWVTGKAGGEGGGSASNSASNKSNKTGGAVRNAAAAPAAAAASGSGDLAALLELLRSGLPVEIHIHLEGDAAKLLKVTNVANYKNTVRTGSNLLAAKGV